MKFICVPILLGYTFFVPATGVLEIPQSRQEVRGSALGVAKEVVKSKVDRYGDPLPIEAIMRLGTIRWQAGRNRGHTKRVTSVGFLQNGSLIASTGWDKTIRIWSCETGEEIQRLEHQLASGRALAISPNGKLIASGAGKIALWDTTRWTLLRDWQPPNIVTCGLAFSPDGKLLASVTILEIVHVWEVATGRNLHEFRQEQFSLLDVPVTFSPDGLTVASGRWDGKIRTWCVASGKKSLEIAAHNERISALSYSPDGHFLVSGSADGSIRMWGLIAGKFGKVIEPHNGTINCVSFSADGRMIAVGTSENSVSLWEVSTGFCRRTFLGHRGEVNCVAFSPNGKTLISGSDDKTVLVWGLATHPAKEQANAPHIESKTALGTLWDQLGDFDARKAYQAILLMLENPTSSVPFLKQRLTPAERMNSQQLERLIKDLESPEAIARENASNQLQKIIDQAEGPLRSSIALNPSEDFRKRVKELLASLDVCKSSERLRSIRAVEALETIHTSEAVDVLQHLAVGAPDALLTKEAKASLKRLKEKRSDAP